jgi:hypothetical protein
MRVCVAGPIKVRRGQTVSFILKLRKGMKESYCAVFSSVGYFEPSPYIPFEQLQFVGKKPAMLTPTTIRLSQGKPERSLTLISDEDCSFYLMQDIDVRGDPLVKGRIKVYGKLSQLLAYARRWFYGDA